MFYLTDSKKVLQNGWLTHVERTANWLWLRMPGEAVDLGVQGCSEKHII